MFHSTNLSSKGTNKNTKFPVTSYNDQLADDYVCVMSVKIESCSIWNFFDISQYLCGCVHRGVMEWLRSGSPSGPRD